MRLIMQRPLGGVPAGAVVEIIDSDLGARLVASGDAVEVSPLAGPGSDVGVRHREAQLREEAAVAAAKTKKSS